MRNWKRISFMMSMAVLGATAGVCFITPVHAETIDLECRLTPKEADAFVKMGYPDNAGQILHVRIDTGAQTAGSWESATQAGTAEYYPASITNDLVTWAMPPDSDGNTAKYSLDRNTNVLTTIDPDGNSTLWNCQIVNK